MGERKWIEERILREEVGHWELDFIVGRYSKAVLLAVVDSYSRYSKIELLPNRTKKEAARGLSALFEGEVVKTILTDNDIALSQWRCFENLLGAPIYFCHPYYSLEKGLVENTNKRIRHFIPKRTDLGTVTKAKIRQCLAYLNDRPGAVLSYRTANDVYYESLTSECPI